MDNRDNNLGPLNGTTSCIHVTSFQVISKRSEIRQTFFLYCEWSFSDSQATSPAKCASIITLPVTVTSQTSHIKCWPLAKFPLKLVLLVPALSVIPL